MSLDTSILIQFAVLSWNCFSFFIFSHFSIPLAKLFRFSLHWRLKWIVMFNFRPKFRGLKSFAHSKSTYKDRKKMRGVGRRQRGWGLRDVLKFVHNFPWTQFFNLQIITDLIIGIERRKTKNDERNRHLDVSGSLAKEKKVEIEPIEKRWKKKYFKSSKY